MEKDQESCGSTVDEAKIPILGWLDIQSGEKPSHKKTYRVTNSVSVIGRGQNADVRIHDTRVSRRQCELIVKEENGLNRGIIKNLTTKQTTILEGRSMELNEVVDLVDELDLRIVNHMVHWKPNTTALEKVEKESSSDIESDAKKISEAEVAKDGTGRGRVAKPVKDIESDAKKISEAEVAKVEKPKIARGRVAKPVKDSSSDIESEAKKISEAEVAKDGKPKTGRGRVAKPVKDIESDAKKISEAEVAKVGKQKTGRGRVAKPVKDSSSDIESEAKKISETEVAKGGKHKIGRGRVAKPVKDSSSATDSEEIGMSSRAERAKRRAAMQLALLQGKESSSDIESAKAGISKAKVAKVGKPSKAAKPVKSKKAIEVKRKTRRGKAITSNESVDEGKQFGTPRIGNRGKRNELEEVGTDTDGPSKGSRRQNIKAATEKERTKATVNEAKTSLSAGKRGKGKIDMEEDEVAFLSPMKRARRQDSKPTTARVTRSKAKK